MSEPGVLLVLPILVPLAAGALLLVLRERRTAARVVSVAGLVGLLGSAVVLLRAVLEGGILATTLGGWPAPFGITLAADTFSAMLVLVNGVLGLAIGVYALGDVDDATRRLGFAPYFHVLLAGISGAFLTGDLFNLYVWFEVMLIATFGLLVSRPGRAQTDGAVKYVAINLVATTALLVGIGLLYGLTGTLNLADLHGKVARIESGALRDAVAVLLLLAFAVKAALFPLFFWLPASYHTTSVSASAIFAGMLTKVGAYAMFRLLTLVFPQTPGLAIAPLLAVAMLTMVSGVLGAASQTGIRRILSFHIVSQLGYIVLGLALYTRLALTGAVFYLMHHILVKANLFLVGGLIRRAGGSFVLADLGGLYRRAPLLAVLFLVPAGSLAGFPPLSGFWAKLLLILASLEAGQYLAATVALVVGFLTIYSMAKIWIAAFWKPAPHAPPPPAPPAVRALTIAPVAVLAAITVVLGLWPQPFLAVAERAADELLDSTAYVEAVLGKAAR